MSCDTGPLPHLAADPHSLLLVYLQKPILLPFLLPCSLTRLNYCWALPFLILSLHPQELFLCSSSDTYNFLPILYACFSWLSVPRSSLLIHKGLVALLLNFLFIGMVCSWASKRWSSNIIQPAWSPLPSIALSYGTLSGKSMKRPNFALLMFRAVILLFALLRSFRSLNSTVTETTTAFGCHIPDKLFLIYKCEVYQVFSPISQSSPS